MVKELSKDDRVLYTCEACGFTYEEKEWAEKCQRWCQEHHSCHLEITQHAITAERRLAADAQ